LQDGAARQQVVEEELQRRVAYLEQRALAAADGVGLHDVGDWREPTNDPPSEGVVVIDEQYGEHLSPRPLGVLRSIVSDPRRGTARPGASM